MAVRISKNVSLTPELEAYVDGKVASSEYQTASEVIRAALRLLQIQDRRQGRMVTATAGNGRHAR